MLTGEPTPGIGGGGTQLQAQTSSLGWRIDDLLLTATNEGRIGRLALSAKGNFQVNAAGLPQDFVHRAWEQWRDPAALMKRGADALGLVTRGVHPTFDPAWKEIKNACSGSDVALAVSRIRASSKQTRIFESVRDPGDIAAATDGETVELIRHMHVLPVDFQLDHSELASHAIAQCRQVLVSGDLSEAKRLWESLCNIAADVRLRRGTVTLDQLWSLLRKQYSLRAHPNFAADWRTLADLTVDCKARIEAELPNGVSIARRDEVAKLEEALTGSPIVVVFGDSGTGKSALVKTVLDTRFAAWTQVWLGPDEIRAALSAARRSSLPLRHELVAVLKASSNTNNVLVLDSAERIESAELIVIRRFVHALLASASAPDEAWRLIVISQTQSWADQSEKMLGDQASTLVELELIKSADVRTTLIATPALGWLIDYPETVAVLTNLKTLGWLIEAKAALADGSNAPASHAAVADRLWRFWTDDRIDIQDLTMRLAEREASFERSFAVTSLRPGDAETFQQRPEHLPLRFNARTNRIEFEHDLAADWARFQFLKQSARDTTRWSSLASNPLWSAALRMLGQFLLRQPVGAATAWDEAFAAAEATELPLASEMLLDALCLDPEAERFLNERVDLLLAENGKRMDRLLIRFLHIGTVPSVPSLLSGSSTLGLYIETRYRSVIVGRWLPIARFLVAQRDRIAAMALPAVAKLAETWLSGTPTTLANGEPVPFRREFAEIAIATAKTVQVEKGRGVIYVMQEPLLFTAPLAGAPDLPDEVSCWALEMAGRRPVLKDVTRRIADARKKQAEERAERLKNDAQLRAAEARRRELAQLSISSGHELPPWPLGAMRPIDHDFRDACLKGNGLESLMRTRPAVAAEVLLALIVEDQPYEEYRSARWEIELGLESAKDCYPTAFWKTPFFRFFQIAPQEALQALITLVNFCTERWVASVRSEPYDPIPTVKLNMGDGSEKEFIGGPSMFDWTQENSTRNGHLHCALDALEKWLTQQIDNGAEITPYIGRILRESASVAFLGLLVNLGKYRPALLPGPLAPLLTNPFIFYWDVQRVAQIGSKFIDWHWLRCGEAMFEFAKKWTLAAHRQQKFVDVAANLLKENDDVAMQLQVAILTWVIPDNPKLSLEFRLMCAALDRANYHRAVDPETGVAGLKLTYPESLRQEILAWQQSNATSLQHLLLPIQCEKLLQAQQPITDENARRLYDLLVSSERDNAVEPEVRAKSALALAATLVVCGETWLAKEPTAKQHLVGLIRAAALEVGETAAEISRARIGGVDDRLQFAAFAVMHLWVKADESAEWEALVLRLLTSGEARIAARIIAIAYGKRELLGSVWWRLLQVGLLWSALVMLSPHYGDPEAVGMVWNSWLARIRRFPLRREGATSDVINIACVVDRYQRLERARWERAYSSEAREWQHLDPNDRHSIGLDTDFLGLLFDWLIKGPGTGDLREDLELVLKLWAYEVARMREQREKDGEYALPSQNFGYDLLVKLATLAVSVSAAEARSVWEPVLSHGPEAHDALRHFTRSLFMLPTQGCDVERFRAVWRATVQYGLDAKWEERGQHWFKGERLLGDLLGFGNEDTLKRLPSETVPEMRDLYERWAQAHLAYDEGNLTRFCHFLSSEVGESLRLNGLRWMAVALRGSKGASRWYRDETRDALLELLDTALTHNAPAFANDAKVREALVELAAPLAARSIPAALVLQERIRLLR